MNSGLLLIAGMLCKLPEWTTLGNYFVILNKGVYLSITKWQKVRDRDIQVDPMLSNSGYVNGFIM